MLIKLLVKETFWSPTNKHVNKDLKKKSPTKYTWESKENITTALRTEKSSFWRQDMRANTDRKCFSKKLRAYIKVKCSLKTFQSLLLGHFLEIFSVRGITLTRVKIMRDPKQRVKMFRNALLFPCTHLWKPTFFLRGNKPNNK